MQKAVKILARFFLGERVEIIHPKSYKKRVLYKRSAYQPIPLVLILILTTTLTVLFFTKNPVNKNLPRDPHQKLIALIKRTDTLQRKIDSYKLYVKGISDILNDSVTAVYDSLIKKDVLIPIVTHPINQDSLAPSAKDLKFRKEIIKDHFKTVVTRDTKEKKEDKIILFPPVKGVITSKYSIEEDHFAIDIACNEGTPVKATMGGAVILSDWTADGGYILVLQHRQNILSIYKHNSKLYKKQGDIVKAGEVIAAAGDIGELSNGPHLHFELWINGYAVDPENYIYK